MTQVRCLIQVSSKYGPKVEKPGNGSARFGLDGLRGLDGGLRFMPFAPGLNRGPWRQGDPRRLWRQKHFRL